MKYCPICGYPIDKELEKATITTMNDIRIEDEGIIYHSTQTVFTHSTCIDEAIKNEREKRQMEEKDDG